MHRFYAPEFDLDREVRLPDDEARHLARVLRLKSGDAIALFDGKGNEALARVESVTSRGVTVRVSESRAAVPEPVVAVTLAQALLKSDKMDRVIRDVVMLGVAAVQPFVSKRTDIPREAVRSGVRRERWQRTVLSSVKQCGRAVVPPVLEPVELSTLLSQTSATNRYMFVEPGSRAGTIQDLPSLDRHRPESALVLIGPEGGWDPREIEEAVRGGVTLVTFGKRTLRADAAAAAAMAVLRYVWNDL